MKKKIFTILLVVTITVQIATPLGMLIFKSAETAEIKEQGEIYSFSAFLPYYDENRLSARIWTTGASEQYVIITTDEKGFAVYTNSKEKPDVTNYIDRYAESSKTKDFGVNFPEVYITTDKYENLQDIHFEMKTSNKNNSQQINGNTVYYENITVESYVYNGKMYINNIYIDGIDSETYLKTLNDKIAV